MRKKGEKKRRVWSPSGDPLDSINGFTVAVESQTDSCDIAEVSRDVFLGCRH
jgi:hypothetical protein